MIIDRTINPMANYPYPPLKAEQLEAFRPYKHMTSNPQIVNAIVELLGKFGETVTEEEKLNLSSYVYLARKQFREEEQKAQLAELSKQGYEPLTKEVAKTLDGQKIKVKGKYRLDWFSSDIEKVCKVQVLESGVFLIPPRKRTSGYYLHNIENPTYKLC